MSITSLSQSILEEDRGGSGIELSSPDPVLRLPFRARITCFKGPRAVKEHALHRRWKPFRLPTTAICSESCKVFVILSTHLAIRIFTDDLLLNCRVACFSRLGWLNRTTNIWTELLVVQSDSRELPSACVHRTVGLVPPPLPRSSSSSSSFSRLRPRQAAASPASLQQVAKFLDITAQRWDIGSVKE